MFVTLAAAYAKCGEIEQAKQQILECMKLQNDDPADKKKLESFLELYEHKKPHRGQLE